MFNRASARLLQFAKPRRLLNVRNFASAAAPPPKQEKRDEQAPNSSSSSLLWFGIAALAAGGGYYYYDQQQKPLDYQQVYNAIASKLDVDGNYDDGSYGPVLVRLAWHASGTYDKETKTGGSHGSTMRFEPESSHGANAGLAVARNFLEQFKKQFPKISYADLWSLAGVVAIQEMGGPTIKWRPGRGDLTAEMVTPDGRLPDATKTQNHLRDIFYRMGFNDQEIVALSGAHALGRCHPDRSGFKGPWSFSPTTFSNAYFQLLLSERWVPKKMDEGKKWEGPLQYEDKKTQSLMMLPSDLALYNDRSFYKHVQAYAKDEKLFFNDFAAAFQKLEELGVPFSSDAKVYEFKRL